MDNTYFKPNLDYSIGYAEHLVTKKPEGKTVLARVGIIALCILLFGVVGFLTFGPIKLPHITVVAVVLIIYIGILLWGFTKVEFEYLVVSNTMSVDKIIAGKKRRQVLEFKVSTAESFMPLKDATLRDEKVISVAGSKYDEDAWVAIFRDEGGEKCALIFNGTEKILQMLRYYNKSIKSR